MDTKQISITPFAALSFFFGVAALFLTIIAIFADGKWEYGVNMLSELGISQSVVAANIFNYLMIIGGILMTIVGIGMTAARKDLYGRISSILLSIGMFAVIFVGVYNCKTDVHNTFAYIGFAALIISLLVYAYSVSLTDRMFEKACLAAVIVVILGSLGTLNIPSMEVITFACLCVWLMVQGLSDAIRGPIQSTKETII